MYSFKLLSAFWADMLLIIDCWDFPRECEIGEDWLL
jgi:hypothetical protein